ncbi:MAG: hypothetical protein ABIP13_01780 [Tepidiformaceae bacterium]
MNESETLCSVCRQSMAAHMLATCDSCGKAYHLNQRTDLPGTDCGQVWISEEHLGLEFACDRCLNPAEPAGNLDDVLDLAEAAEAVRMTEDWVSDAAATGALRHRRTSSGVLLFERRDLLAYAKDRK